MQRFMKKFLIPASLALAALLSPSLAQETPEQIVQRIAALGEGVHDVEAEAGRLKFLRVAGQERISTVLGASKGLQTAQKRATLKANAAFVEWMKKHVKSISSVSDETIVTLEGDGKDIKEQGKSSETTRQEIATKAEGLVRGLTLVGKEQQSETLTLVFNWSPKKAALAADASAANSKGSGSDGRSTLSKDVPRKTVVSPDFDR